MKIKTFDDLVEKAGGTAQLAAITGAHQVTVQGWKKSGVPTKYWGVICEELKGVNPQDMYAILKHAQDDNKKSR